MPKEFELAGIYLPPGLIVGALAFLAALATAMLLNRLKLSGFIAAPPLVFLSIIAIYSVMIGTFLIPV